MQMNRHIATSISAILLLPVLWGCAEKAPGPATPRTAAGDPGGPLARMQADLHTHTAVLAADEFEGRAPATRGEELTVAYLAEQFEALGLQPANGDSWFQEVPITAVQAAPAVLRIRGEDYSRDLAFGTEMTASTRQQVESVGVADSPLVFVGYGINAPERDWNDYADIDVAGKTAVVLINDPGFATRDPELFNGKAMTYYGRWTYKYEEAARQGAAAVLIVHETAPAAYPWEVVQVGWTGPQIGLTAGNRNVHLVEIEGWIQGEVARDLFAAAGLDYEAMKLAARKPGFRAVPMGGLTASVDLVLAAEDSMSRNVVGILPGAERPDEAIIYSAHWDHLGVKEGMQGDNIYNGAVDNASGVAGLLGLARLHSEAAPYRRSLIFLAVTAEESGLLGSEYYAANPFTPNETAVANLNMDGVYSFDGRTRDIAVVGYGNSRLEDYLRVEADGQQRVIVPEPNPEKGYYYRSDHFSFARRGIPALYLTTATDSREHGKAWGQNQLDAYVANDYHKPSDEYSPDWDMSGAAEDVMLFFGIGEALANGRDWPNWNEGNEFKATRDATADARDERG